MKEERLFSEDFFKELTRVIFIIFSYIIFKDKFYDKLQFWDKIKDSLIIAIPSIICFSLINIVRIFKRPVFLNVRLENLITSKEFTEIYHYEDTYREDVRTVVIKLDIQQTNSFWVKLALRLVKNKDMFVKICVQATDEFICQPLSSTKYIEIDDISFNININKLIVDNLDNSVPISISPRFIIIEDRDNPPKINGDFPIKPKLFLGKKEINFLYKIFIKFYINMSSNHYTVNYYINKE